MKSKIPKHMNETNQNAIGAGASGHNETPLSDLNQYAIMVRPNAGFLLVIPRQILEPIEDDLKVTIV